MTNTFIYYKLPSHVAHCASQPASQHGQRVRTNKNKTVEKFFVVTWWKFCSHSIVCLKDIRTFVNTHPFQPGLHAWLTPTGTLTATHTCTNIAASVYMWFCLWLGFSTTLI